MNVSEIRGRIWNARGAGMPAAAIVALLFAAGCGGGGNSTSTSSPTGGGSGGGDLTTSSLSKAQYVTQASAACNRQRQPLLKEIAAYVRNGLAKGVPEIDLVLPMAKKVLLPAVEAEIAAVRKLGAPEGEEAQVEAILAANQAAVDKVKNLKKAGSLEEIEDYFFEASKKFRDYGFTGCTNSP